MPIILLLVALVAASCTSGGSSDPASLEIESPAETDLPVETPTAETPDEVDTPDGDPGEETGGDTEGGDDLGPTAEDLAFVDVWVAIDGDRLVRAVPGETLTIDYVIFNPRRSRERFAIRANGPEGFDAPEASRSTVRIESRDFAAFTVEYVVPDVAEVGDVFQLEVFTAMTDDASRRAAMLTTVEIVDAEGERPMAGDDGAEAPNSDETTAFVIGNDLDADNDADWKSATIVGGGFRAQSVYAYENGTVVYTPFNDVWGNDVVIYEICDKENRCDTALINIRIAEKDPEVDEEAEAAEGSEDTDGQ